MIEKAQKSLVTRSLLLVAVLVSAIMAAYATVDLWMASQRRMARFDAMVSTTAEITAEALVPAVWNLDDTQIEKQLQALTKSSDYAGVRVEDQKGGLIYETGQLGTDDATHKTLSVDIIQTALGDPETIGKVTLSFSRASLMQEQMSSLTRVLIAVTVLLAATLLAVWSAFSILTKPLKLITEAMSGVASKMEPISDARLLGQNEIGVMGRTFNQMVHDIAEQQREVIEQKERAEAANKAKTEFLSNMSHELRTPMHAIINYADMALKKLQPDAMDKLNKYLTNIHVSGERLLKLINNLLDLSKLEAGHMQFHMTPQKLAPIVQSAMGELDSLRAAKKLEFVLKDESKGDAATFDVSRITQVIINLLGNAIKFSPEGCPITVQITDSGLQGGKIEVPALHMSVTDRGLGIPAEEIHHIFDKFVQSSKTKTGAGGTGLGLSISKEIVERHGGVIWAENHEHGGAVFHVLLPMTPDERLQNQQKEKVAA